MDNQNIGGPYQVFVAEDNSTVYVRLLNENDVIRTDDDFPYTFYRYPSNPVSAIGGGIDPGINSAGEENIGLSSVPADETLDDTPATTYGYALDGRRVGKAGAVEMKYLYDGENVVYELWNQMTVRFTHPVASGGGCGSGACGAGSCDIFFTDHPISITIWDENGIATKYYYLYDGLGSVTELIDVNENVVNAYRYSPFGETLIREETVYNPYQYTGRQYDAESGLYHYRARAYSADIGRFMQQDPAGMLDGPNMYAYVGWNPVNRVDPSGMLTHACSIAIGVFIISMLLACFAIYVSYTTQKAITLAAVAAWGWAGFNIKVSKAKDFWGVVGVLGSIGWSLLQHYIKTLSFWSRASKTVKLFALFVSQAWIVNLIGITWAVTTGILSLRSQGCI